MFEIRNFMDTAANDFKKKGRRRTKQKYLKAVYDKFLAVKAQYPSCIYDPPRSFHVVTIVLIPCVLGIIT